MATLIGRKPLIDRALFLQQHPRRTAQRPKVPPKTGLTLHRPVIAALIQSLLFSGINGTGFVQDFQIIGMLLHLDLQISPLCVIHGNFCFGLVGKSLWDEM